MYTKLITMLKLNSSLNIRQLYSAQKLYTLSRRHGRCPHRLIFHKVFQIDSNIRSKWSMLIQLTETYSQQNLLSIRLLDSSLHRYKITRYAVTKLLILHAWISSVVSINSIIQKFHSITADFRSRRFSFTEVAQHHRWFSRLTWPVLNVSFAFTNYSTFTSPFAFTNHVTRLTALLLVRVIKDPSQDP